MKNKNQRSHCPISCTLDIIGDKWTLIILRDILFFDKARFDEFLDSPEKIASNVLTDRLHKLEEAGLITKAPYSNHRLRMSYTATTKGKSLTPILKQIAKWGLANIDETKSRAP